jgi:uncharacterized protein
MRFEWDEDKRIANLKEHGIDFVDAEVVFAGPTYTFEDDRLAYDEQRFITLGLLRGIAVSICHTERGDVIRVISFRKATSHEEAILYQNIRDQLPAPSPDEGRRYRPDRGAPRGKRKAHRKGHRKKRPKGRAP